MINVPQSNVKYVTNLPSNKLQIMQIKLTSNISVKRIYMCMDKRNKFGAIFVNFSQIKRYLRLFKNLQFCELRYSMCIICIRRGTNIAFQASVFCLFNLILYVPSIIFQL